MSHLSYGQHFSTSTIQVKPLPNLPLRDSKIEAYTLSSSAGGVLTEEVKEWFYWTNFSRSKPKIYWDSVVLPILNSFPNLKGAYANSLKRDLYSAPPLEMLKPSDILMSIATTHADDLRFKSARPSHTSPSGITFQNRMTAAGIKNCGGENISFGPSNTVLALLFLYIDEGIPDLGHRKALLNPSYKEMGIGIAQYSDNNVLIIQDFSCSQ